MNLVKYITPVKITKYINKEDLGTGKLKYVISKADIIEDNNVAFIIFTYDSIERYLIIDLYKRIYTKIGMATKTNIEPVIRKTSGLALVKV